MIACSLIAALESKPCAVCNSGGGFTRPGGKNNNRKEEKIMTQKQAIDKIYRDLNAGRRYGRDILNVTYPYFSSALWITECGNIGWQHYGSSAERNTKKDLNWIIKIIFKLSPVEFLSVYYRDTESVCKY